MVWGGIQFILLHSLNLVIFKLQNAYDIMSKFPLANISTNIEIIRYVFKISLCFLILPINYSVSIII